MAMKFKNGWRTVKLWTWKGNAEACDDDDLRYEIRRHEKIIKNHRTIDGYRVPPSRLKNYRRQLKAYQAEQDRRIAQSLTGA